MCVGGWGGSVYGDEGEEVCVGGGGGSVCRGRGRKCV